MPIEPRLIRRVFEDSLSTFLDREKQELLEGVNERSNCSRWAKYLEEIAVSRGLTGYYADTEYNRKQNGQIKTILNEQYIVIPINCDLILHSRGSNVLDDNLIAIELKKSERPAVEREKDRARLRVLTRKSFDGVWVADGTPPEHVCGYVLGAYVEIDRKNRLCAVEYYAGGNLVSSKAYGF